jgi:hypothetical protein
MLLNGDYQAALAASTVDIGYYPPPQNDTLDILNQTNDINRQLDAMMNMDFPGFTTSFSPPMYFNDVEPSPSRMFQSLQSPEGLDGRSGAIKIDEATWNALVDQLADEEQVHPFSPLM